MKDINRTLSLSNGDFNLLSDEETMLQNQDIVINSDKGKIINAPLIGVGITKYLNGPINIIEINREIKAECEKIGIFVRSVEIVNGEIYITSEEL